MAMIGVKAGDIFRSMLNCYSIYGMKSVVKIGKKCIKYPVKMCTINNNNLILLLMSPIDYKLLVTCFEQTITGTLNYMLIVSESGLIDSLSSRIIMSNNCSDVCRSVNHYETFVTN